jgi:hypothetical protein
MFTKRLLPLTITSFLALAAVANASNAVRPSPRISDRSCGLAQNSRRSMPDYPGQSVIGGIQGVASNSVATGINIAPSSARKDDTSQHGVLMTAELEMAVNPASDSTPSSCYPPLSFTTTSIPAGTVGVAYTATLNANGGQPPYSWSFGHSSLPVGFAIGSNGDLTGTPSEAGSFSFHVVLSDSLKNNVTGELTLTVDGSTPPPQPPPTQPPPTQPPPTQPPPTPPQPPPTQPPPTQPPPTQPPPTQPPPTQPPPTQPPPTQPPPTQPPPTQPPPTQPPPSGPPTGTALTACGPITASGSYYLANDVSSTGTCFPLGANNVSLNLNGHAITYGTGGGSAPTPAFSACSSWYTGLAASQCLGGGSNLTVYGGTITQSTNAAPFSPVFWMGQGDGSSGGGSIHDLTVTFQSVGSQFFHGEVDGGGYTIQTNVINDNVTNIQQPGQSPLGARAAFQGYVIHTDEESTGTPKPDTISGNTFNGSPQGGVADGVANSQIYSNTIKLTSYYSNDYGVIVTMNGQNVHDNTITGRGRGLDAETSGFILNHNTINVAEEANNSEYSGCELDGTYGIRVKNYDWPGSTESGTVASTNFQITNNNITTPATVCESTALDLTDMNSTVTGTISGNTFSAPAGPGGLADALGIEAADAPNITFQNNQFSAPTCLLVGGNGDIAYGAFNVQSGQTWSCSAGPTIVAQDYTYQQTPSSPPVVTIQDSISNPTVSCGSYSTATVSIGSGFKTTCSLQGN